MIEILKFICRHPLNKDKKIIAIIRFLKWQISSRLWRGPLVYEWINDSRLIVSNGMTGATGNIYVGLMEYEDMSFLLHYLQEDDLFFDIGANVGVYTVLASKIKKARTVSIEPLPRTYERLSDNIAINRLNNVVSKNIGLSHEQSKLYFTTDMDTMNGVATLIDSSTKEIDVDTLDNLYIEYGAPKVIKIDVEGYETNVLKGGKKLLENENLEVIILELNGNGRKYGFDDDSIHNSLNQLGFNSFTYNPSDRKLIPLNKYGSYNTIYIRNSVLEDVSNKVMNAKAFECNGKWI